MIICLFAFIIGRIVGVRMFLPRVEENLPRPLPSPIEFSVQMCRNMLTWNRTGLHLLAHFLGQPIELMVIFKEMVVMIVVVVFVGLG